RSHVPQDELSSVITGGLDYSKNVTAQQRAYGVAIAAASALIKVHTHPGYTPQHAHHTWGGTHTHPDTHTHTHTHPGYTPPHAPHTWGGTHTHRYTHTHTHTHTPEPHPSHPHSHLARVH